MKDRASIWFYIKHFKIHSIFLRNFLLILCLVILPVMGISGAVYLFYNKVMKEEISAVHLIALSRLRDMIDMTAREVDDFSLQLASDEAVTQMIEEPQIEDSDYGSFRKLQSLRQKITPANKLSSQFIDSVYLYSNKHEHILSSNLGLWRMEWYTDKDWLEEYKQQIAVARHWISSRTAKQYIGENGLRHFISLFFAAPLDKKERPGAVIVNIDVERLGKYIHNVSGNYLEDIYIVDKNDTVLYNRDFSLLNRPVSDIAQLNGIFNEKEGQPIQKSVSGVTESITYIQSQYNDWRFISVIPLRLYQEKNSYLLNYLLLIFTGGLLVALLLAWLIATKVLQPIRKIISIVENPDQWTYVELEKQEPRLNEIRLIAASIAKSHGKRVELEQELRKRLTLLKQAQHVALQSQINPHFLYNTLETINWNAMRLTGGENKVSEMISSLSKLLRLSLEEPMNLISIQKELEHAQHYIDILLIRYKNKFKLEWDISVDVLACKIPRITLQPLVENAIYHGIKPKAGNGTIRISGHMRDEHVLFEISDDGVGVSPERAEEINAAMQEDYSQPGDHIGMINVNQRIKLTFGEAYGLTIASELNKGTTIRLILPIVI
jgi:two-component system sensor histidine kinase YesM